MDPGYGRARSPRLHARFSRCKTLSPPTKAHLPSWCVFAPLSCICVVSKSRIARIPSRPSFLAFFLSPLPPSLPSTPPQHSPQKDKFTVLINTFKRPDLLRQSIKSFEDCDLVDAIHVIWSEQSPTPDRGSNPDLFSTEKEVVYHAFPTTSFTNRFFPVSGIRTSAVLNIDDDVYLPCAELDRGFSAWRKRPHQLAGFFPRAVAVQSEDGHCVYRRVVRTAAAGCMGQPGGQAQASRKKKKAPGQVVPPNLRRVERRAMRRPDAAFADDPAQSSISIFSSTSSPTLSSASPPISSSISSGDAGTRASSARSTGTASTR